MFYLLFLKYVVQLVLLPFSEVWCSTVTYTVHVIEIVTTSPSAKQQAAEAGKTTEPQTPDSETSKAEWLTFFSMYTKKFILNSVFMYMHALQRKSHICIPFLGIAHNAQLSPNYNIHVSVSELYISRIGPHISCSRLGRSIGGIYKSLTDTWMWKLGLWTSISFSGNICVEFWIFILCSVCKYSRWRKNRWRRL